MARLRMMRAPQKYVQGKDSLLHFHEEMKDLGDKWLFICSNSGHKMKGQRTSAVMKSSAELPV